MGRERVRCPLLEDEACRLYDHRPITCRVYGIPTVIQGKARVCSRAGFRGGKTYPAFNLDAVQRELYALSRELLVRSGEPDAEKAALLISVSKALQTPIEEMIAEGLG